MIVVHHLDNSRSQRVLWLLEELGIPYEIQRYQRDAHTMLAPPELRRVHPLGKSPVITDDERVVAESGAIIDYIIERHGDWRHRPARTRVCATTAGCTMPKARPCRRCCSSWCSIASRAARCRCWSAPWCAPLPARSSELS